jgi:predicted lipoprotein with Yx(FWY)xxD motif
MATKHSKSEQTDFGLRLEQALSDAGLAINEAAKRVGMAQSTLSHAIDKGAGTAKVASLARECGVNAYWLETGKGDRHPACATQSAESVPSFSPEAENLAAEFDEAPLGRSDKSRVHRLCLAIILYGGLPPYTDLIASAMQSASADSGIALPGTRRKTHQR